MHQRNDGSNKGRTVLANKIGAIFSAACGTATIPTSRNMPFAFGFAAAAHQQKEFDDNDGGNERPISASNKTHPCNETQVHAAGHDATNCMELSCKRRPIAVASTLSGILTRKWKTSLKRVKVRLKRDVKTKKTTTTNAAAEEAKTEMELCKKRILMGEKCRALNLSGVLHYDKQGILLPED